MKKIHYFFYALICLSLCCCSDSGKKEETKTENEETEEVVEYSYDENEEEGENDEEDLEYQEGEESVTDDHFGDPADAMEPLESASEIRRVSTAEEFIEVLASDVTIIIENEEGIDLTGVDLPSLDKDSSQPGVYRDNWGILLYKLNNLTILGGDKDPELSHLFVTETFFLVLSIEECSNIQLRNLKLGHQPLVESLCSAGVVYMRKTNNVEIDNCKLYGCGLNGLSLCNCMNVNITKSSIYECVEEALVIYDSTSNVLLKNCMIRDCPRGFDTDSTCDRIELMNCRIATNSSSIEGNGPLKLTNTKWFYKK